MFRFYYTITFNNGCKSCGHNCTNFETKYNFLILEGFDDLNYVSGYERQYWRFKYELNEVKEFRIERMEESEKE